MSSPVFGDFLGAASQHLTAAVTTDGCESTWARELIRDLHRVVAVMSRYCDDLIPCNAVEAASRDDLREWERAAIDVASALRFAAGCVRRTLDEPGGDPSLGLGHHFAAAGLV